MIDIHYNFTDGTEVSYIEGRELDEKAISFTTCCLSFFQLDFFNSSVTVYRKAEDGSTEAIFMDDLINYHGKHTDKEIRFGHNVEKMLRANAFTWVKVDDYVNKLELSL